MNEPKFITWDNKPFTLFEIADVCNKLSEYAKENIGTKNVHLGSIERSTDKINNRYDIELLYADPENGWDTRQKLLIMNGEVIDGIDFHRRFNEFYPTEEDFEIS